MILRENSIYLVLGIIFSIPIIPFLEKKTSLFKSGDTIKIVAEPILYFGAFIWAISFLILGAHNPFIYFNF